MKYYYEEVEDACWKSVEKWLKIYHFEGQDFGIDNCALCGVFNGYYQCEDPSKFGKCPIFEKSAYCGCSNTPYDKWIRVSSPYNRALLSKHDMLDERQKIVEDEYAYLVEIALEYGEIQNYSPENIKEEVKNKRRIENPVKND